MHEEMGWLVDLLQGVDNAVDLALEPPAASTPIAITPVSLMRQLAQSPMVSTLSAEGCREIDGISCQ